jgi:hypothetical protein
MNILKRLFRKESYFMKNKLTEDHEENIRLFEEYYTQLKETNQNALVIVINKTLKELNRYELLKESSPTLLYACRLIVAFYTFCINNLSDIKHNNIIYDHTRLQTLVYKNKLSILASRTSGSINNTNTLLREAYATMSTFFWSKPVKE